MNIRRDTWAKVRDRATLATGLVIGAAGLAVTFALAAPAMAAPCPAGSSCASATVTVNQGISFAFTSATSFNLTPGVLAHSAVAFSVSTNDPAGYSVTIAAPDPATASGQSFPATDLAYETFDGNGADAPGSSGQQTLTNTAALILSKTQPVQNDAFHQDWLATLPANVAPGAYSSQISYVATGR